MSSNKSSVLVMMAVYNGEAFLKEQIESIVHQSYSHWELLIRDDGSTDSSRDIIQPYLNDRRITFLSNDTGIHGCGANFRALVLAGGKYDYYMFSDQDDIWDERKIEYMVSEASAIDKGEPLILHGNMRLIDKNGAIIGSKVFGEQGSNIKKPVDAFFTHAVHGCNMMINKPLFIKLQKAMNDTLYYSMTHDAFAMKINMAYGGTLRFADTILMSYRRHSGSCTAGKESGVSLRRFKKLMTHFDAFTRDRAFLYWTSLQTTKILLKDKDLSNRRMVEDVNKCLRKGGVYAIYFWCKYRVSCGHFVSSASHLVMLCLGTYKKYMWERDRIEQSNCPR